MEGPMVHGQMLPDQQQRTKDLILKSTRANTNGQQLDKEEQKYLNKMKNLYPDEYAEILDEIQEELIPWYL